MYFGQRHNPRQETDNDRRTIMRRHLIYYLRVWDLKSKKLLGHIVDINSGGFMLISEKEIKPHQTFNLEIDWNTPDNQEVRLQFQAESRWSSKDVNPAFFNTGFRMIGPSDEVLEPIHDMIKEYGFQD